ncbi:uncharacterized protein LOC115730820 [Rhodamnia argentea]|uniref:Uncharacterized protein LOC115730820 n=1 Tax=Rhodamnia argentea TaxID=178133 RepID=A0ABM3HBL3_9MYRT|nr:uncharacterized protein LOC115730820 [Rhodamnia argentea]
MSTSFKLSTLQCPKIEEEAEEMASVPYASVVGSLMYAMVFTHPYIAHVVEALSKYMSNSGKERWMATKRVLRYLCKTSDFELCYEDCCNQESNPMETQPGEQQGNSNPAEPPADGQVPTKKRYDVHISIGSAPSQSRDAPEISENVVDNHYYRPLLQAAFRGDWQSAKRFFEQDSASKTAPITSRSETVLHIAALMRDCDGRTALHNAVLCGRIRMVKALVRCNPNLTQLADNEERVPFGISALEASMHKDIAWFLAKRTTDDGPSRPFSSPSAIDTMINLTYAGHHDITIYLVWRYPRLLTMKNTEDKSILYALAIMGSHFPSGTRLNVLEALIYKCISVDLNYQTREKDSHTALQCLTRSVWNAAITVVPPIKRVHEVKLKHVAAVELAKQVCIAISYMNATEITDYFRKGSDLLFQATVNGISELVKLCIQFFPELIGNLPDDKRLTTHAVEFRHERTLRLFLKASSTNELSLIPAPTREESSDMLLGAAQFDPKLDSLTKVSGATFQLQRELQWFKAVEKWVIPDAITDNIDGKTYWQLFVENHKTLLENGEKWVKDTANSCMLVSTLIATVLFAAAFTVLGGNDSNTGAPLLLRREALPIFAISDALGLFSSVTAILLFLAILTSRYEPQDFLDSLPKKIIMGLCFLFLSLAFMLVAFAAALTIVLDKRLEWVFIPITLLTSLPVFLFLVLQLPLLYQMVKSTYGPSIFRAEDIWK